MKLIVGLGNPGQKYLGTRHNLGFLVIDELARRHNTAIDKELCDALIGAWFNDGETIVLAKPRTFMNRSGTAVRDVLAHYHGAAEDLVVVYDDLDLPFGRLRIRPQGSTGGHRGVLSIQEHLDGVPFCRLRVGIGRPPPGMDPVDYVLETFEDSEKDRLPEVIERAAAAIECILAQGVERAMGQFNRSP